MANPTTSVMAEFDSPESLETAIRKLRSSGHMQLTAYTPYPVPAIEDALQLRDSWIPRAVLIGGLSGVVLGFVMQWVLNGIFYPLLIGGFAPRNAFVFTPITFETMILCSVLTTVASLLIATRLPRLWHPVFEVEGFESATRDGFWLACAGVSESEIEQLAPRRIARAQEGVV